MTSGQNLSVYTPEDLRAVYNHWREETRYISNTRTMQENPVVEVLKRVDKDLVQEVVLEDLLDGEMGWVFILPVLFPGGPKIIPEDQGLMSKITKQWSIWLVYQIIITNRKWLRETMHGLGNHSQRLQSRVVNIERHLGIDNLIEKT